MSADHGRLRESMDKYGVISTEVHDVGACIPDDLRAAYVNDSDRVGAMLGLDDTRTLAGVSPWLQTNAVFSSVSRANRQGDISSPQHAARQSTTVVQQGSSMGKCTAVLLRHWRAILHDVLCY